MGMYDDEGHQEDRRGSGDRPVDIRDVDIITETDKAILVDKDGWIDPQWFPLSQVSSIHRAKEPYKSWIVVSRWIAEKKGIL